MRISDGYVAQLIPVWTTLFLGSQAPPVLEFLLYLNSSATREMYW